MKPSLLLCCFFFQDPSNQLRQTFLIILIKLCLKTIYFLWVDVHLMVKFSKKRTNESREPTIETNGQLQIISTDCQRMGNCK